MFKKNRNNIINAYTNKLIEDYYKNKYISKQDIIYLKKCKNKIKNSNLFLHITPNLDKIIKSQKIYCSSGGLGGVLYTVPIDNDLIHNLGTYIYEKELPNFIGNKEDIKGLVIELTDKKIGCVDYLNFGKWYYEIYQMKNVIIDEKELNNKRCDLLSKSHEVIKEANNNNLEKTFNIMSSSNYLKTLLFECLLEYLFLFQIENEDDTMNNYVVKDLIYEICPSLKTKFSLKNFNVDFKKFEKMVYESNKFITSNLINYIANRIIFFVNRYIINNYDNMMGQIIFRDFGIRKQLEKELSKMIWKEAKKKNYNLLTYIIPKGEMGILPSQKVNVFNCEIKSGKCFKKGKIDVKIVEELYKEGIMRNPYESKEDKNGITN